MRGKKLLAAFLLGVSLCFIPVLGYGEVKHRTYEYEELCMKFRLLEVKIDYIMANPTDFLKVSFYYDPEGRGTEFGLFPEGVDTKDKINVMVYDNRDVFSDKAGLTLLQQFKKELKEIDRFLGWVAPNMDTDVVAIFHGRGAKTLGYFYEGEYHLWEK